MEALPYTVINSQNQYKLYCESLEDLISIKKKTRVQLDTIALLRLLILCWDEEQRPLSDSDSVAFLRSLMKQHSVKASDLAADLGISKSLLSDILHYRRRLSREVIRKLAFRFKIPQELLNKPYNLVPAAAKPAKSPQAISQPKAQPFGTPNRNEDAVVRLLQERKGLATIARLQNGKEITIWNIWPGRRLADPSSYLITNLKPPITDGKSDIFFTSAIGELIDRDSGEVIFRADG
jgi:HTH-type transcriptional regulator/antitoxin HigA